MADDKKGAPSVTPKSKTRESLEKGQRASTGGNPTNRMTGNYSKSAPQDMDDPFDF